MRSKLISNSFICLFLAACDGQEQTVAINKTTEIKIVPEKTLQQKPRPALNLTVDDISIEQENQDDVFNLDKELTETHSDTFKTLTRDQAESNYNLNGKILTDEEKIDNKEYMDAVDGLQINIEGSFQ
jgi:hypothetical protein